MLKLNSFCSECFDPHKVLWNCKKHIDDKDWKYLCYNCILINKHLHGRYFKSQFQNIKSLTRCSPKPSKSKLSLYEISPNS